ncbi:MAG: ABC transporter ATP-binding protein [Patescibacteria group bacterium]
MAISKDAPVTICLNHVFKQYTIHHEKPTLVEKIIKGRDEKFLALEDISLTIHQREKVGIIGPNGAGKTTLLKIIAGITMPTAGKVETVGRVVSLIDLEAGFHPDLTGEQNIYLNGMLLGMKRQEITKKLSLIISFADIGSFIDTPLFTYSEGMRLRLGFSVAVHADPDVLILDEGLSAGDIEFQKKSQKRIQKFFAEGKTILVASHWLDFIKKNCQRVIFIKKGRIVCDGSVKLIDRYKNQYL